MKQTSYVTTVPKPGARRQFDGVKLPTPAPFQS